MFNHLYVSSKTKQNIVAEQNKTLKYLTNLNVYKYLNSTFKITKIEYIHYTH